MPSVASSASRSRSSRPSQRPTIADPSGQMFQMFDRLAGRLSLSDQPEKFQKLALTSLLDTVSAETMAWVPAGTYDPVPVAGETGTTPNALRQLVRAATTAHDSLGSRSLLENRVQTTAWGDSFPAVRSLAIVVADPSKPSGWLVAINKKTGTGFQPGDTAVMGPVASLLNVQRKNLSVYADLKELLFGVVRALTSAIDAKDHYTRGHSERVARMAVCVGRQLKLGSDELSNLYLAGLLHDIGKIGIEDKVLKKPDQLTDEEYRHVMSHVEVGTVILRELKRLRHVLPGVRHHHERYDGLGYPDKLQGENIPLIGRILAVADAFDAMSSDRSYRRRRTEEEVQGILQRGAGSHWDPKVIEAASTCWEELKAIQQRGLGESLRVAVDDALLRDDSKANSSLKTHAEADRGQGSLDRSLRNGFSKTPAAR